MKQLLLLFSLNFLVSNAHTQTRPLSQIEGVLEVYDNMDSTSLYIGKRVGSGLTGLFGSPPEFYNTYLGYKVGMLTTTGKENTLIGSLAGLHMTTGSANSILGYNAGMDIIEGSDNTIVGHNAGADIVDGCSNSFFGTSSGTRTTSGFNSFFGAESGLSNINGSKNVFIGHQSGQANTSGSDNIFVGADAGHSNTNGFQNTMIGRLAGQNVTSGHSNTFIGFMTGSSIIDGDNNIIIGHEAGPTNTRSNELFIDVQQTNNPLIHGLFEIDLVRVNGDFTVTKNINATKSINLQGGINGLSGDISLNDDLLISTPDGDSTSLRLVETNGLNEFGFKLNYNGSSDLLELSTVGFNNNEGVRAIWTKSGRMGIGSAIPVTPLHVSQGTDVENGTGGYLTIGSSVHNLALDNNEIMARTFSNQPNALFLNNNGGEVVVGSRLRLAYTDDSPSDAVGQIRYNTATNDFEGYDGMSWYSLTTNKSSFASSLRSTSPSTKARETLTYEELKSQNQKLEIRITKLESAIEQLLNKMNE